MLFRMTTAEQISRNLSEVIKTAAATAGISQRDLADRTGIALVTLNRKLNHNTPLNALELGALSEALGISLVELAVRAERQTIAAA